MGLMSLPSLAQYSLTKEQGLPPQAQSGEELSAYLDILLSQDPMKIVSLAADFERKFPTSEFTGPTQRMTMHAYQSLDDYDNTVATGRKALQSNPDDVDALLTLANVLPNGKDKTQDADAILREAERDARHALAVIPSLKAARTVPLEEWLKFTAQMKASAHEALGQVAFNRHRFTDSVQEFEICTNQNPVPDGRQFYRLGLAYFFAEKPDKARIALKRASDLGPDIVRDRAKSLLVVMQK
jgi:tetratricopeptide (TPR) repeat protein